jgi:AmiR/NasT family two-component response regulator
MAHEGLNADEAFDKLRQMSNDQNRKLREVSQDIVTAALSAEEQW